MRSILKVVVGGLISTTLFPLASAQTLFQNANFRCETQEVLCASEAECGQDAESLACRYINRDETFSSVDFNGDGFADCVALGPEASSSPSPNLSVLINLADGATACEPGPGNQFNPSLDYNLDSLEGDTANVIAGNLNGGNSDIGVTSLEAESLLQAFNPGTGFGPDGGLLVPTAVSHALAGRFQASISNEVGERSMALFDCNGDDALDAVIAVEDRSPQVEPLSSVRLNLLRNNGLGLQPLAGAADSVSAQVFWNPANGEFLRQATVAVGDFDNDDDLDLAVAIDVRNGGGSVEEAVNICFNNGSCGFTCEAPPTINLFDAHPGDAPNPSSIEAGDFNGDGNADVVVALRDLQGPTPLPQGLQYYFGDGSGGFPNTQYVGYPFAGTLSLDLGVLTTGCYNNDNVRDVAVTSFDEETVLNNVGVFTSDGSGGLNPPLTLFIGGTFTEGIDTADFDQAGGDDIMVLADVPVGPGTSLRHAVTFMNGLETVSAIAGADQAAELGQALAVAGASCVVTPEIATPFPDPASFEVGWTMAPAAGAVLSAADTLTPTFTATAPGSYTLTLSCRTRCTTVVTDTKTITVGRLPVPSPSVTPGPSPLPTPLFTQGGCLASLSPTSTVPPTAAWALGGMGAGWAWIWARKRRRAVR